jgi:predicted nucleic acid-binding Zn ribbon protein
MTQSEGPEPLSEILSRLFVARGWGRRNARRQLEQAWEYAVGVEHVVKTRVIGLRRAVLEVEVSSTILLQELAHFHKRRLLERLKEKYPSPIKELRFRSGTW